MELNSDNRIDKAAMGITEGRIVHYCVPAEPGLPQCRAAVIVNAWDGAGYQHGEVNLTVFTDWNNDAGTFGGKDPLSWQTSVPYSNDVRAVGTWHFPQAHSKPLVVEDGKKVG